MQEEDEAVEEEVVRSAFSRKCTLTGGGCWVGEGKAGEEVEVEAEATGGGGQENHEGGERDEGEDTRLS